MIFVSKMESVGRKLHQNFLKKFQGDGNASFIVLQCYVYCCEMLCSCSGQESCERDRDMINSSAALTMLLNALSCYLA